MVTVEPLALIGSDERGATFVFDNDRTGQFIVVHRKKGSISGRQFHKGRTAHKNPEKLLIMQGTARLNWRDTRSEATGSALVEGPAMVQVPAYVWHELVAETDFVMLELNALADGQGDTFSWEER
jgi:dTDP-4-dehydrorhamnose 3,5-epimerase-like enzyme